MAYNIKFCNGISERLILTAFHTQDDFDFNFVSSHKWMFEADDVYDIWQK